MKRGEPVSGAELERLIGLTRHPEAFKDLLRSDLKAFVVRSDITIGDDLELPTAGTGPYILAVLGNLTIGGNFTDRGGGPCATIVSGHLRARAVVTRGHLDVAGDLVASYVIGDYNDGICTVRGKLRTGVFYPEDHLFEVEGGVQIQYPFGDRYQLVAPGRDDLPFVEDFTRELAEVMDDDILFTEYQGESLIDCYIEHGDLVRQVLVGEKILVSGEY